MIVSLHVYTRIINQHLVGQSGNGLEHLKQLVIDSNSDCVCRKNLVERGGLSVCAQQIPR